MFVFNQLSDWGFHFSRVGAFFVDFFYNLTLGLGDVVKDFIDLLSLGADSSAFLPLEIWYDYLNSHQMIDYLLGFGLSFFIVAHLIKLLREGFLI